MALNSINTNTGALVALQNLNQTNRDLAVAQNRVNTGQKVSSAKDNGAIFAIAAGQRAEMAALDSVKQSMQRGQSIVDVAMAAGDTVMNALTELKSLAVALADSPVSTPAGAKYKADFDAIVTEIGSALRGAKFDGVNLFDANATAITVKSSTSGSFDLKAAGGAIVDAASMGFDGTDTSVATVEAAIASFTGTLADFGTKSKSLDRQLTFTAKMQDALETGVGNLVDADLAKESARLTALQTKQQLGVQALSIANQSSSIVLSLFR